MFDIAYPYSPKSYFVSAKSRFLFPSEKLTFANPPNSAWWISCSLNAYVTIRRNLTHRKSYFRTWGHLGRLRLYPPLINQIEFSPKSHYNDAMSLPFKTRFISAIISISIYIRRKKNYSLFASRTLLFNGKLNFRRKSISKEAFWISRSSASARCDCVAWEPFWFVKSQKFGLQPPQSAFWRSTGNSLSCRKPIVLLRLWI